MHSLEMKNHSFAIYATYEHFSNHLTKLLCLFVYLLACFWRINNIFPFRVKFSFYLSCLSAYRHLGSILQIPQWQKQTNLEPDSLHFPYRSKSSVRGGDKEEKWHSAAHPCVLPHLHTLHHRPALHNEASESTCGMEKRWGAGDLMGGAGRGIQDAETTG